MSEHRLEVADVFRTYEKEFLAKWGHVIGAHRRKAFEAIRDCRTAALGGHVEYVEQCDTCGHQVISYNSCRNRHCPKCQAMARAKWLTEREAELLPVPYFHVVFTLPAALRALCVHAPRAMYSALFSAASETLLDLARDRWGATPGVTMVLHTWTRELLLHPHVHALVTGGGLALDASHWVARVKYLFPVEMMGEVFRGKMLETLRDLHALGAFEDFGSFEDPEAFEQLVTRAAKQPWVVYAKKPFRRPEHVLKYLGRYTHRVGISNSRLLDVTDTAVTFSTKNGKQITLDPVEFLRRFVLHVLPERFKKVRHYGLYASVPTLLQVAREHLEAVVPKPAPCSKEKVRATWNELTWEEQYFWLTGRQLRLCPVCGGTTERRSVARAPPRAA